LVENINFNEWINLENENKYWMEMESDGDLYDKNGNVGDKCGIIFFDLYEGEGDWFK